MPEIKEPKTVAPRKDPKPVSVYANSRANQLAKRAPGFRHQWFSLDPKHPQYIEKYTVEHEIGGDRTGYCMVPGWQVCTKEMVEPGRPRDDQGKPVDSSIKHGDLILARIPEEDAAAYDEIQRRRSELAQERVGAGGKPAGDSQNLRDASFRAQVGHGLSRTADHTAVLS